MDAAKGIVVYSNLPFKRFRWITYYSAAYVSLVGLNLLVLPFPKLVEERLDTLKNKYRKREKNESGLFDFDHVYEPNPDYVEQPRNQRLANYDLKDALAGKYFIMNLKDKPALVIASTAAGFLVPILFQFYLRRLVHKITIVPNDRVKFEFFSAFAIGRPPCLEVPLNSVSCEISRSTAKRFSILKLKNHLGYHLVSVKEGTFHDPKLYDSLLGYQRSWAVRRR